MTFCRASVISSGSGVTTSVMVLRRVPSEGPVLPILLVLFVVVPLVELYAIIQVGQAIGALPTIGLLILDSIIGAALLRSQGRAAWRRFQAALAAGRPPAREVADGALVILGGALLLTPGFVTDVFGAILLIPPTRAVVRRVLARNAQHRIVMGFARSAPGPGGGSDPRSDRPSDVDGTAVDVEPRSRRLP